MHRQTTDLGIIMSTKTPRLTSLIDNVRRHIDCLDADIFAFNVSEDGELKSVSKDPEDDETECPHCPDLDEVKCPKDMQTVSRGQLREIDRLGPNVDLVSYDLQGSGPSESHKVVFKYYFMDRWIFTRCDELNIWMRLPPHPHIVPFDKLVVDELKNRPVVVGFTSLYIPGGTVDENPSRIFKLKWLEQLLQTVDDLNLKYGIQHQDIAARNFLVDDAADKLLLFDFNYAVRIGYPNQEQDYEQYDQERNDIKGAIFTLYEIITKDEHFREVAHAEQDPSDILNMDK